MRISNKMDDAHPPLTIMVFLTLLILLAFLLGYAALLFLEYQHGSSFQEAQNALLAESTLENRNFLRFGYLINTFVTFLIPGLVLAGVLYRRKWAQFLGFRISPLPTTLLYSILGIILIIAAFPLAQLLLEFNQSLYPVEGDSLQLIKSLLITEAPYELGFNIIVIALLPAIGEEIIFRGIIQTSLRRLVSNPHLAIWITGAIFSFFHFQLEGFLPRMFLGALLGYLFYWSRNIWVPIIAHFFNNALQIIASHLHRQQIWEVDIEQTSQLPPMIYVISIIFVLGISYFFIQRQKAKLPIQ